VLFVGILVLSVIGISLLNHSRQAAIVPQADNPSNMTERPDDSTGDLIVKGNVAPVVKFGTAATLDYVDSNYDSTYGTVVNFANMQSADSTYATLSEEATTFTQLEYKNVWTPWPGTGWSEQSSPEGHTDFEYMSTGGYDGTTYAGVSADPDMTEPKSGILRSPVYNMNGVERFRFSVYLKDRRLTPSAANIDVEFKANDGRWIKMFDIDDCDPATTGGWRYKQLIVTDSSFMHSQFQVRYYAHDVGSDSFGFDMVGVDAHKVERGTTHRLDQYFEFTNIASPNGYSIERLYIDLAYTESEYMRVSVWDWSGNRWAILGTKNQAGLTYWNVHSYLTQSTFRVRIEDTVSSGDNTKTSWRIRQMYLYFDDHIPFSYRSPTSNSLYDGDNFYAMKSPFGTAARIVTYHQDDDGAADIDYCSLRCYIGTNSYWEAKYTVSTGLVTVTFGSGYVNVVDVVPYFHGSQLDLTWQIEFKWDHPDITNLYLRVGTQDSSTTAYSNYGTGWDVETRVEFNPHTISDDRCDVGASLTASGDIRYYQSSSGVAPLPSRVHVRVTRLGTDSQSWNAEPNSDGEFSVGVTAASWVGDQEFRFQVLQDGTNSDLTASYTSDTTIGDRIKVDSMYSSDSEDRVNVGDTVTISAKLIYEYDGSAVTTGTVTIDGTSATHQGNGVWTIDVTRSSVMSATYNTVVVTGDTYDLSTLNQNGQSVTVIWDKIIVGGYTVADWRVDIDTTVTVDVSLTYAFDGADVVDGTVTINGYSATYVSGSTWRVTITQSSVTMITFDAVACSGNQYGITSVDQNGKSQQIVWDKVEVILYHVEDAWVDIGVEVAVDVTLEYSYDSTAVTDGTVTINGIAATHQGGGVWRILVTHNDVTMVDFNTVACSGNVHGITVVDQNGQHQQVVWDKIVVRGYNVADTHVDIGTSVTIQVTLEYEYDDSDVTDGTVTINSVTATYTGSNGVWEIVVTENSPTGTTYDTVACYGNEHGITYVDQDSQSVSVVWDAVEISITDPFDQRINIGENASGIVVSATYAYDGTKYDGTVTLNSTVFSYNFASKHGYTVSSVGGDDTYGISVILHNDVTYCIWDALIIRMEGPDDSRIDVGTAATGIEATAIYAYDGAAYDGTLALNSTVFLYNNPGKHGYTVASAAGDDSYGITHIMSNDQTWCIWDGLIVTITGPADQRINVGWNASGIVVSAVYAYDGASYAGDLTLNSTTFVYSTVGKRGYTVVAGVGNDPYGIKTVVTNDETYCVWDGLVISFAGPADQRINIGENASGIAVSAAYAYDGGLYTGDLTLNSTTFLYSTVGKRGYTVSSAAGNGLYGITAIVTNDVTYCVWDALNVQMNGPDDSRINVGDEATGIQATATYAYDGSNYDGTLVLNSTTFVHNTVGRWGYTVASALGDDSYGITVILSNDVTSCIWDALDIYMIGPVDSRIDVGEAATGISASATYVYDGAVYDGTLNLNSTVFVHNEPGKHGYTVASAAGDDSYGITAIRNNDVTFCIWDRIIVVEYWTSGSRINMGTTVGVNVTLRFEYDSAPVVSGIVTINGHTAHHIAGGMWSTEVTRAIPGQEVFDTVVSSGNVYGISLVNQNSQSTIVIWDGVDIYDLSCPDWVMVGEQFEVVIRARLAYDGHALGDEDTMILADTAAVWNGSWFVVALSYSTPGSKVLFVNSTSESTYGITALSSNPSVTVRVSNEPEITGLTSDFAPADDLYTGVYLGDPLWIIWDPVNDKTPPSFEFDVSGAYLDNWTVVSSWSGLVVKQGNAAGHYECQIESALPYSTENYTYTIRVWNTAGYKAERTVAVSVRDYTPPEVSSPDDIEYEMGTSGHSITWTMDDIHPDKVRVLVNGSASAWVTWSGSQHTESVDGLSLGVYEYTIEVTDTWGNIATDTVLVTVVDTTKPEVSHPDDITMAQGDLVELVWTGSDLNPSSYEVTRDGTVVMAGAWNSSSEEIVVNLSTLPAGSYVYVITLTDTSENSVQDSVVVTVEGETTPTTPTTPTESTTTTTPSPTSSTTGTTSPTSNTGGTTSGPMTGGVMVIILAVAGAAGVIVVVIVILVRRRAAG